MTRWIRLTLLGVLAAIAPVRAAAGSEGPPKAAREFRAVWVATVGNIDWPSRPGLDRERQQAEARALLDRFASLKLNAVVFQVRTAADALYESELEPWSAVVSGRQGQPPDPPYDPLRFWVDEAHRRGLQLHAWFNPFRAKPSGARYELAETHAGRAHPDWVKTYGDMLWMDPGEPAARGRFLKVVADVARRYDVDGIHIDDYFYPYPIRGADGSLVDFPDESSWAAYKQSGGDLGRSDWRRQNISRTVEDLNQTVHETRAGVLFGVSPFGIPRPGRPPGVKGFDQYESLYADTELWLRRGWCDYWTPQLYWKIDAPEQPFRPLLAHWIAENARGRHVWPGLSISRVGPGPKGYAPDEILGQIAILRETRGAGGHILFSAKALMGERQGLVGRLGAETYRTAALVPPTPWVDHDPPAKPVLDGFGADRGVRPGPGEPTFLWAVWTRRGEAWEFAVKPAVGPRLALIPEGDPRPDEIVVSAVDRLGNESEPVTVNSRTDGQGPR